MTCRNGSAQALAAPCNTCIPRAHDIVHDRDSLHNRSRDGLAATKTAVTTIQRRGMFKTTSARRMVQSTW